MRRLLPSTACLLFLLAAGCGSRLNDERTVQVPPASDHELFIDPSPREQTVRVQVQSPGAPVNVYCYFEKDKADVEKALQTRKTSDKIRASKEKVEEIELEFPVPANTRAIVMLSCASSKKANVKVKLTN